MRTYYCVEMGCASYPVNEIRVQTRPFTDPETDRLCVRVRAASAKEAEEIVRNRLSGEREQALREVAEREERGEPLYPKAE